MHLPDGGTQGLLFCFPVLKKLQKMCFCQNLNLVGTYQFSFKSPDNFDWSQRSQAPCFNTPRKENAAGNGPKGAFNFTDTESVSGRAHVYSGLFRPMVLHAVMNQTNTLGKVHARVIENVCELKGHTSLRKVEEWKGK